MNSFNIRMPKMKKIIITGPESSGKTTLAKQLAQFYQATYVPEYSRSYLSELTRPYVEEDLLEIAKGQAEQEKEYASKSSPIVIYDTSMLVLKVWSEYKYGRTHPWIEEQLLKNKNDLYLLCKPDVPWEEDPLRENPLDRDLLFSMYLNELKKLEASYFTISGPNPLERLQIAAEILNNLSI